MGEKALDIVWQSLSQLNPVVILLIMGLIIYLGYWIVKGIIKVWKCANVWRQKMNEYEAKFAQIQQNTDEIEKLKQKHVHDMELVEDKAKERKQQSIDIQQKLNSQIDAMIIALKEQLADKINEKYKYYISIKGIPEDELDEFVHLHDAYKLLGGNSSGDAKFNAAIALPVIPVETKLKITHD